MTVTYDERLNDGMYLRSPLIRASVYITADLYSISTAAAAAATIATAAKQD